MRKKNLLSISVAITIFSFLCARSASAVYICNPDNGATPEVAIEACNKEISAGRSLAIAYYDRGLNWAKKKEFDKALADYNQSLKVDPNYQNAYIGRGNALSEIGQADRAIADYDRAIKIDPVKAGLAYYNRGNRWRDKDEKDKAIADYDKAIDLMPSYLNAYVARGNIWKAKAEYDKAVADYDQAIRINSSHAGLAYYNRGTVWRKESRPEKALADLNIYIEMMPSDPDGYVVRGNIYQDMENYTKAVAEYDHALLIDPNNALAKTNKANAEKQHKNSSN